MSTPAWRQASLRHPGRLVAGLHVVVVGSGPPLILLHGNMESHRVFDAMVPLLAPHHTLIGIDSRAHGDSPRGDGPLTIARMAQDIAAVITELDLTGAPILGFSDGGNIALQLALDDPDLPGPLIVVGSNLYPRGMTRGVWLATEVTYRVLAAINRVLPGVAGAREKFELMARDPQIDPAALAQVTVPVLVVTGERDLIRPEHTEEIIDALPHARGAVVPEAGHALPQQRPAQLAHLARTFLADVAG